MPKIIGFIIFVFLLNLQNVHAYDESWTGVEKAFSSASVPSKDIKIIINQAQRHNVTSNRVLSWANKLLIMKNEQLPVTPGIDRIQQGLAKSIPAPSISTSLDNLHRDLLWAKNFIDQNANNSSNKTNHALESIENLEVAKRQGYDMKKISMVLANRKRDAKELAMITELITNLNAYGLDQDFVISNINGSLEAGMDLWDLQLVSYTFETQAASGAGPQEMIRVMANEFHNIRKNLMSHDHSQNIVTDNNNYPRTKSDMDGGLGINETFLSPSGEVMGSGSGSGSGGGSGSGSGGGMWGGHHGGGH